MTDTPHDLPNRDPDQTDAAGNPAERPADGGATPTADHPNLSTEHQQPGDAKRPGETLDRDRAAPQDDGGRRSSFIGGE